MLGMEFSCVNRQGQKEGAWEAESLADSQFVGALISCSGSETARVEAYRESPAGLNDGVETA